MKLADMNSDKTITGSLSQKPLRLWPGVVIVILQWLTRFVIPEVFSEGIFTQIGVFAGILGWLAIIIWWAFFSRAPKVQRWGALVLMIIALAATSQILDKSIKTSMMGLMFIVYSTPVLSLVFVLWAVVSRNLSRSVQLVTMVVSIIFASGLWALLRTDGMDGEAHQIYCLEVGKDS